MRKLSCIFVTAIFASLPSLAVAAGAIDGGTKQAVNWVAIGMFVAFVALTLGITYWAAKQTHPPRISILPAAASPVFRTASRSPATTCRRPLSWVSRAWFIPPAMTA